MSNRSSASRFASSVTSDESYIGVLPIVSLLEDVDAYASKIFDLSAKTIMDLQRVEQLKSDRCEVTDWRTLGKREILLAGFLHKIEEVQEDLADMRRADWPALSLVWGNGSELVGEAIRLHISMLAGIERQVSGLRENFDGKGQARLSQLQTEVADELLARHKFWMNADIDERAIRRQRAIHPCRGALRLIKGDDRGGLDRCLKKDLTFAELERLSRGGLRGTYLFWQCDSCEFRIKYFASKSRAASLLTNDDHLSFKDSKIRCSRAFLAMSHLEQWEARRLSGSHGPPRYTCILCALHRPAAGQGRSHVFSNRDDYAKHIEYAHMDARLPPAFVLRKMCVEHGERLPDGVSRALWIE